ncbi:MAG: Arylamine N-acetyltransferase [Pseudomonadota bacterium]|jgi:N-hydroxyarylamine O-acetyltransferase
MPLSPADLARYCKRIGYDGTPQQDLATLQHLHRLHPQAIPFENLDSWLGRPVSLEPAAVFDKLVVKQRGGYCFEQNLLFREVLEALGFSVRGLAARVLWNLPEGFVLPRTHMLLLVNVAQQRYIADVGFGGLTLTAPLQLDNAAAQLTPHETFRIIDDAAHHLLQADIAGAWQSLYRFGMEEQLPSDYAMSNWYVSMHPESRFVLQLLAGRAGSGMRHALLDGRYTRHHIGRESEQQVLADPAALRRVLQQELGIRLSELPEIDARIGSIFTTITNNNTATRGD